MKRLVIILLSITSLVLNGCGHKGRLYLPNPEKPVKKSDQFGYPKN